MPPKNKSWRIWTFFCLLHQNETDMDTLYTINSYKNDAEKIMYNKQKLCVLIKVFDLKHFLKLQLATPLHHVYE